MGIVGNEFLRSLERLESAVDISLHEEQLALGKLHFGEHWVFRERSVERGKGAVVVLQARFQET